MLTKAYCENSGMVQQRPISNHCSAGISWKSCIVNSGICHIQALQMQWNLEAGGQPWKRICEDYFCLSKLPDQAAPADSSREGICPIGYRPVHSTVPTL